MKSGSLVIIAVICVLSGCDTMYYQSMEKIGVHKRDIMIDRVKKARDTQDEAKKQFLTAMEQFRSVVDFRGGNLEKKYDRLNATLQESEAKAAAVRTRIDAVEDVSDALFKEWRGEIKHYSSDALRRSSQRKYDITLQKYKGLIGSMRKAEARLEPALVPLRDQVLFLKHNLNAQAIAGLEDELGSVQANVDSLIRDLNESIAEADSFIAALREE